MPEALPLLRREFGPTSPDGKCFSDGHGVDPDFVAVGDPADLVKGVDRQLEKGIEVGMQLLKDHPPVVPKQPAYEKR